MDTETQAAQPAKIQTKTLAEQGPQLPIGITDSGGNPVRAIGVREWKMKQEKELGELRDKEKDASMAQYVSMILSSMCTQLGPHDLEKMKPQERRVVISQMFMADVFYAYTYLRTMAVGSNFHLKIPRCPSCKKPMDMTADLGTVEVKVAGSEKDTQWTYKLQKSFTVRGKEVKELTMGAARWSSIESASANGQSLNAGLAKATVIRASLVAVDGQQVVLAEHEMDDLSKLDMEALTAQIEERAVGPQMIVEENCDKCSYEMKIPIDWSYDSFFGSSSR